MMRRRFNLLLPAMMAALLVTSEPYAAERSDREAAVTPPPSAPPEQARPSKAESTDSRAGVNQNLLAVQQASAKPATGEQIQWRVISGGGHRKSSTNYVLSGTLGQIAVGEATTTNYKVNQGFWQAFAPAACCLGTTGNTDGDPVDIVDISDVFAIVGYLVSSIPMSPCFAENEITRDGTIDISDLQALVDFLVISLPLPACP